MAVAALATSIHVATPAPVAVAADGSRFVAGVPCRLADVRDGTGLTRIDDEVIRVVVTGRCGVPAEASAVALTVTADNAGRTPPGFVTIWPTGQPMPTASMLNHVGGQVRANGTIVAVGIGGAIDVWSMGAAPVIVDVTGWFVPTTSSAAGRFVPITPYRAFDSRVAFGRPLAAGETVRVPLPPGVPPTAVGVAATLTATESSAPGYLTAFPAGSERPLSSNLNTDRAGQTRAAGMIVGVTASGIDVFNFGGGHMIVDVTGWFTGEDQPVSDVGLFVPTPAPQRLLDTRNADPVWADGTVEVRNVDPNAAAMALNVTIVNPLRAGYLTAHAARQARPPTSSANAIVAGEVAAAMAIVPTSTSGVAIFASHGADAVVDVSGWFTGPPGAATQPPPTNVRPPDCTHTTDPDGLNAFFRSGVAFTGADYQRPMLLPDGRVLWLFQDVYVRGRYGTSRMIHNAGLVQNGTCFTVLQSGNYANPDDYLFGDVTQFKQRWFWPMSGAMGSDGLFHVFVAEMRENGDHYLAFTEPIATWKVAIDPTSLQVVDRHRAVDGSASLYGWSVTADANYTYLYAHCHRQFGWDAFPFVSPPVYVHDWNCAKQLHVARVPRGRFDLPLAYWNGSGWGSSAASAANIAPDGRSVNASQVYYDAGRFLAVTKVGDWWGTQIVIDSASRPQGPFTQVRTIATPPKCSICNTYFASVLPYPGTDGSMLLGISNNVFGALDLSRYDPSFFAIPRL